MNSMKFTKTHPKTDFLGDLEQIPPLQTRHRWYLQGIVPSQQRRNPWGKLENHQLKSVVSWRDMLISRDVSYFHLITVI